MEQDKLNFAKNYRKADTKIKNRKKLMKDLRISFIMPGIFVSILAIMKPIFLLFLLFEGVLYGTFAGYAHLYNRNDIDNCNVGNKNRIKYADYKEMKKSGELDKLIQQINEEEKQEAEKMYKEYLEFVKGKSYTSINTSFTEEEKQADTTTEVDNINNL